MPRPGGEADKLGNRYESLWAVDALLDLIDGEYVDLVFEPVGDEAAGVEFFGTNQSGPREYHSIKRQQSGGNWTISRLKQKGRVQTRSKHPQRPHPEDSGGRGGDLQFRHQRI